MNARITHPTAFGDQVAAASKHAHRILTDATARGEAEPDPAPPRAWLAAQAEILITALHNHTARVCAHVGAAPQLLNAAAWHPGVLVCTDCAAALDPDPIEDVTCDRCRRPALALTGSIAAFGPILFAYALCDPCTKG
ncbi:hypothetical protein AB0M46_23365 [Dactylosporangium sp. NPDC051485]|uniref:hypothetical protein n=1 Tax=Dactylosporangium sp. NPDC051485 TaxID=3154846 RepID=UPI0034157C53